MNLQGIYEKLGVLLNDNHIPAATEVEIGMVDVRGMAEGEIVGIDTYGKYGKLIVVIQVQEHY